MANRKNLTTYDLMNGMRALAAFEVLIGHVRDLLFVDFHGGMSWPVAIFYGLTGFGYQAVIIFFVLSGYWISRLVVTRADDGRWSWRWYLIDRLTRLWIVLVPALMAGAALDIVGRYGLKAPLYFGTEGAHSAISDVAYALDPVTALGNVLFLQTLWVKPLGSNGPLWSLANEFWYYIWFPGIFFLLWRRKVSVISAGVITITIILFSQLLAGFCYWLLGAGVFLVTSRPGALPQLGKGKTLIILAALGLSFGFSLLLSRYARLAWVPADFLVALSFGLIVSALLKGQFEYPAILRRICEFGASSSFSLYVFHFPIVMLAVSLVAPGTRSEPSLHVFALFSAIVAAALLYSFAWSRLTESNTKALRQFLLGQAYFKALT